MLFTLFPLSLPPECQSESRPCLHKQRKGKGKNNDISFHASMSFFRGKRELSRTRPNFAPHPKKERCLY